MCPADQASFIVSSVVYRILSPDIYFGKTVRPMYISFNSGCGWVTGDRNNKHYNNGNLFWLCRISRKFLLASVYYSPVYQYFICNFCEYYLRVAALFRHIVNNGSASILSLVQFLEYLADFRQACNSTYVSFDFTIDGQLN